MGCDVCHYWCTDILNSSGFPFPYVYTFGTRIVQKGVRTLRPVSLLIIKSPDSGWATLRIPREFLLALTVGKNSWVSKGVGQWAKTGKGKGVTGSLLST